MTSGALAAVVGHEILVPSKPRKGEEDLLREAIELSADGDFRSKRAAYWRWQNEFLARVSALDQSALDEAIKEMMDLVEGQKRSVSRRRIQLGVSFAFAVGAATTSVISGPVGPWLVASAFLSVGVWVSDHAFGLPQEPGPAAMCYSAERAFGWGSFLTSK
jgi:hypothetical protein